MVIFKRVRELVLAGVGIWCFVVALAGGWMLPASVAGAVAGGAAASYVRRTRFGS
jgi:hypothetical protein